MARLPDEIFEVRDRRNGDWFWCQNLMLKARINHTIKLTYFAICTFANKNTEKCHPGMRKIAKIAGISHRSVRYAIQQLEKAKAILVERGLGRGITTRYTLLKIKEAMVASLEKGQPATQKRGSQRHKKGDLGETKQDNILTNENNNCAARGILVLKEKIDRLGLRKKMLSLS